MKITGLSCGRKNGNNEVLLKEAMMAAEELGAECELICLRDLDIKQCTGCESCMRGLVSGKNGDCVLKGDDYAWLMDKMTETDGLILAAPIYDIIPCGRLITLLNRALGAGRERRDKCRSNPKVSAAIAVGGSDWIDMAAPMLQISLTNLCKGTKIADRIVRGYNTAPSMILLDDEILARARLLGQRVAKGILNPESVKYEGDTGACPVCSCSVIEPLGGTKAMCAFCGVKGEVQIQDGEFKFVCTPEAMTHERFSLLGEKEHQDDIRAAHKKSAETREYILEKLKKYSEYGVALKPQK